MRDEEKLSDLGVINGELVYLLPEPPAADGVTEQPPEYPVNQGYAGAGMLALFGALALVLQPLRGGPRAAGKFPQQPTHLAFTHVGGGGEPKHQPAAGAQAACRQF